MLTIDIVVKTPDSDDIIFGSNRKLISEEGEGVIDKSGQVLPCCNFTVLVNSPNNTAKL